MSDLPVIQKTHDLIQWYVPILNRLPKAHKFTLGDRIVSRLYDLLEGLIQARYSRDKLAKLYELNLQLEVLRHQTRLLLDFELISAKRYAYVGQQINGIGVEIGGWIKQQKSIMKRYGNLWPEIVDFENLLQAARQAQRGKRYRPNVLAFNHNLDQELLRLQAELIQQTYRPGGYRTFKIDDPKPRLISAAPYRDRVVHHALCNVIVPPLEQTFIDDTYANRLGYRAHRALKRFTFFARTSRYILQCDLRKYFPSIDHDILKTTLRRKIKCPETLWLIDRIIDGSNPQGYDVDYFPGDNLLTPCNGGEALPIGNLTSQFFANLYLNRFDHFVKEQLKARKYLRYVDDFALFSNNRGFLVRAWAEIEAYLTTLRLRLHPIKSQLFETRFGANFVGFRVLPDRIRVRNDNLRRARLRCRRLQQDYTDGQQSLTEVVQRLRSWEAHLMHGDTQGLRHHIFDQLIFHPPPEPLSLENSLPFEPEMEF